MAKSVKLNFILNLINSASKIFFPLITFPYSARVLGPDGIGQVNFYNSIISYVLLFTSLGIPLYAIKEISTVRGSAQKINETLIEIFILSGVLTLIGYVVVLILCVFVPQVYDNVNLFLILSLTLLFSAIGCDWFYQGIEDFKYITIRGIIVKLVSLVFLFVFVKTKTDLIWYGIYWIISSVGGNLFNFYRLRKFSYVNLRILKSIHPLRHIRPMLQLFTLNMIASIYLQLNTVMLGFFKDPIAVGFYTSATKIITVVLTFSSSLGQVMLPRLSNLISLNKKAEFISLAQKSYNFTIAITLPICIGLMLTSRYVIMLLCGKEYVNSIIPATILSPVLIFSSLSNVMGTQILYPLGKINTVIKSAIWGCLINVLLNIILLEQFSYIGAAISYCLAEFVVMFSLFIKNYKYIPIKFYNRDIAIYSFGSFVMGIILLLLRNISLSSSLLLFLLFVTGIFVYLVILICLRDSFSQQIVRKISI